AHPTEQQQPPASRPWHIAADRLRDGPAWPAEMRTAALARLDETGLPDVTQEDWRYTSLARYQQRWSTYLATPAQPAPGDGDLRRPGLDAPAGTLVVRIVDGVLQSVADTVSGLTIQSLRGLTPTLPKPLCEILRKADSRTPETLVDLNSALASDVIFIGTAARGVPDGTTVHVQVVGDGAPAFGQPRLLVDIASGTRLTLVLEHSGTDGTLSNAVTQVWIGRDGHLDLIRVQDLPDDGMLTETTNVEVAAAASLAVTSIDIGGLLSRQALTILLAGAGASATVEGLFIADGKRHIDNRTRLEHRAPQTTSRETFRGLADGHGRGVFNGKIIVLPGAAGSNAALTNRNLLLAPTAEIDTKPELEIYVDDVRCSHGATTGQLDANALFYLRTRGLDPAAARQVLTAAFLRQALGGIATPALRARLEARLQARLKAGLGGES
ncbi:MAG: Fe-S cluster assembly protein SufD, partial [Gammaproteobacteria bacterium]